MKVKEVYVSGASFVNIFKQLDPVDGERPIAGIDLVEDYLRPLWAALWRLFLES